VKTKLESKLGIDVVPSKHIIYDAGKLSQSIAYFCYHQLKDIDPNELPDIYIEIDTEYANKLRQCGETSTWSKNMILVALSTKNISEDSQGGFAYGCCLKSLFHVFLHEFHHLLVLIELYLKRDKGTNLIEISEQRHKESVNERRRLRRSGCDLDEVWINLDKEQDCEWFAFQNLALFENLYDHDFLYVPGKAFMAKVKKAKKR
jgi:hypothetical protein